MNLRRIAVTAALVSSCSPDASSPGLRLSLEHDTVLGQAGVQDTTLLMPTSLAVGREMIVVADNAGPSLRVLTLDGELTTVIGRKGAGPGEIGSIGGIALWEDSLIAVADPTNKRVSVFSPGGRLVNEVPIRTGRIGNVAMDSRSRLHLDRRGPIGTPADSGAPTVEVLERGGRRLLEYGHYIPDASQIGDALLNTSRLSATNDGGVWQLLQYQGELNRYSPQGDLQMRIKLPPPKGRPADGPFVQPVEGNPLAVMIVRMPVAEDVTSDPRFVYVLVTQIEDGRSFSEILVYNRVGELISTFRLTDRARSIEAAGGKLYVLVDAQTGLPGINVYEVKRAVAD